MNDREEIKKMTRSLTMPLLFLGFAWLIKIAESIFGFSLSSWGIEPLSIRGLRGIFLFHFLHGSWEHLLANTLPILFMGSMLYYFYRDIANRVALFLFCSTGLWIWCGARSGVHIGASCLIYGLASFIIISGFIRRNLKLTAIAFVVIFLYGSLVWGLFPKFAEPQNISWEGHLSGFFSGLIMAVYYRKNGLQDEKTDNFDDNNDDPDDEPSDGEKPYWDVPVPDKKELDVVWHYRKYQ